ncbi:MAG: TlpA family protein disulfide reductase [Caldimonas sp.]
MSSASATDVQSPPPRDSRWPQTRPASRGSRAILLALIVCAVAAPVAAIAKTPGEVEVGQTLRDATLRGLNGPTRKLSDFRGRPVIINVWASWCGPCRQEMASLERLAWKEHATPFAIIGISTDDYPEKARRLLDGTNATISHFIDANLLLENMLGASRLPLTVLVDANGRVVDKIYGARQWDSPEAMALIGKAFAGRGPAPGR